MKRFILFIIGLSFIASVFYNMEGNPPRKISDVKEVGNNINDNHSIIPFQSSSVLDTSGRVPRMTGYYDYVTNGNNLHRIWVSGDTVVVSGDHKILTHKHCKAVFLPVYI
jgi:hypothetical protein